MAFQKIKFKHFQRPSGTDSRTFKDHVCFQGLSKPWKSGKIIPGLSRPCKSPVTYRQTVAADARFLHALRSAVLLHIEAVLTLAAVLPRARLALTTSDSPPPCSLTTAYYLSSLAGLWLCSTSRCFRLTPLRHLDTHTSTTAQNLTKRLRFEQPIFPQLLQGRSQGNARGCAAPTWENLSLATCLNYSVFIYSRLSRSPSEWVSK